MPVGGPNFTTLFESNIKAPAIHIKFPSAFQRVKRAGQAFQMNGDALQPCISNMA